MAFSPVHEIEIDSTYRLASSNSATDFEYQLPFTWPTLGPSQIRLTACYIPNTIPNLPSATLSVAGTTASLNLDFGVYTFVSAAARLTERAQQAALSGGCGRSTLSCLYDFELKRYYFIDTAGGAGAVISITSTWMTLFGHSNITFPMGTVAGGGTIANTRYYLGDLPAFGVEELNRVYIRIQAFENKIILPNQYNSRVTYVVPLDNYLSIKDIWIYDAGAIPQQKVLVSSSYFNTNNLLKIQLINRDGQIVNLLGRNWLMSLRVEPLGYQDS